MSKKKIVNVIVTLCTVTCALLGGSCSPTAAPAASAEQPPFKDEIIVGTPQPTSAPSTPAPTETVACTPIPAVMQQDWGSIADNGIDGIGTVRGNTNGNLNLHGRAVKAPNAIYYVGYSPCEDGGGTNTDLLRYDLETSESDIVFHMSEQREISESFFMAIGDHSEFDIAFLNWYADKLWFVAESAVYRYDANTKTLESILQLDKWGWWDTRLIVAYDIAFVTRISMWDLDSSHSTLCLDLKTGEVVHVYEDFTIHSVMDGRLYGMQFEANDEDRWYCSMYPDESDKKECAPVDFAADGKLYYCDVDTVPDGNGWFDIISSILVTDVRTGETGTIRLPANIRDPFRLNVSHQYLYFTEFYGGGRVSRVSLDDYRWLGWWNDRLYYWGITLLDNIPAERYVPCDPWDANGLLFGRYPVDP